MTILTLTTLTTVHFLSIIFGSYFFFSYLCRRMRTTKEYIDLISAHAGELRSQYGIRSLRLFGSVSRGEQTENSDVDIFVDTQTPNPFILMEAKDFLANVMQRPVDIIRNHKNLNPRLRSRIERDGIVVF
jgi:predicted nucleotidyltransferase